MTLDRVEFCLFNMLMILSSSLVLIALIYLI